MYFPSALVFTMIFMSVIGFSQESTPQNDLGPLSMEQPLGKLIAISKNNVSTSLTAHTYKLDIERASDIQDIQDINSNLMAKSTSIQKMIKRFLSVTGVSRCTFDEATYTFTILSQPTVSLTEVIRLINNNE